MLVATLGAKSNLKKVTRKAILDVDIPRACNTITDPETPLALRLQASLLYGISRVHSQQCNYVLTDTQSFRDKMRGIAQVMQDLEIDPEVSRTRPEQLNLAEDSGFIPELDLMFDLSAFDFPSTEVSSRGSSVLSPFSRPSSQSSVHLEEDGDLGLDIPSLDTPGDFGGTGFGLGVESSAGTRSVARSAALQPYEEEGIIAEPEFEIAEDGSLVAATKTRSEDVHTPGGSGVAVGEPDFAAQGGSDHGLGIDADEIARRVQDDDMIMFGDDDEMRLPTAEPFPAVPRTDNVQPADLPPPTSPVQASTAGTSSAAAPQQRVRPQKQVKADHRTELQNKDLGDWSNDYLDNMKELAKAKEQHRSTLQGKRNAAFWVLGQGVGGVQANFGVDREPHPLAIFSGQTLLDALMGPQTQRSPTGSKRARSQSPGAADGRRVRARSEEDADEVARRLDDDQVMLGLDDEGIMVQGDEQNLESEVGRRAGSSLPDPDSILPWNRSASASRHGSARPFGGSGGPGISSSVGGVGSFRGPGSSVDLPRSRQASVLAKFRNRRLSASPSMGRGAMPPMDLEDLRDIHGNRLSDLLDEEGILPGGDEYDLAIGNDEFEQYGPAANVDTQTAQTSQWMRKTLEDESLNFLGFVELNLQGTRVDEEGIEVQVRESRDEVTMDDLLPPKENSPVVAAQALLHVLTLVTKGMLTVRQDEPFDSPIVLSAVEHEPVRRNESDEGDADNERVADHTERQDEGHEDDQEEEEYHTAEEDNGGEESDGADGDDEDDEL
ncbi:Meiotic recombination protein rec8 [Cyphellophora attinorum]|uniref:Meiotic recombination protein rec8 n=1 Tax=Cyphellophora attinorum TaxID=1664694 RepID=A0A0N1NXW4_9EURO|nr:Meiotic recombination protein rec8 [Phialophora attinorum]KPI37680.1 Meiotic recombination protein rec8 [Phialophora attinorum]